LGIGYLAQEASVFRKLSVEDNIKAVLEMTELSKTEQKEKLESLLDEFSLQKIRTNRGDLLSGGERRRTEIARALASNPNCPKEIIDFLWVNRHSQDWLLRDLSCIDPDTYERDAKIGALRFTGSKYEIDESVDNIEEIRQEARETLGFRFPTTEMWESGPGAHYVENLLDIQWEADDARTCLLAAFAKNSSLDEEKYVELFKEPHPLIKYFLYNNAKVSKDLKATLAIEGSSFTFEPYGSHPMYVEPVTLQLTPGTTKVDEELLGDVWHDLR
jgi:hypothetical protein